jgi:fructose/tagatose bisphosphate aldolase
MIYQTLAEMSEALTPAATVLPGAVHVTNAAAVSPDLIDRLAWTAVFGSDALRGTARSTLRSLAAASGIRPASIHNLYAAIGRGEAGGFTVPAINVRAMAYDTARAVVRAAKKLQAGAVIFEISRGEMEYTQQTPDEYAAVVIAAALRERHSGPLFIQGDHVQISAKKFHGPDRDQELEAIRALIRAELAAGFYNIDIDASTLVDLAPPALADQQHLNATIAAELTAFVRAHQPEGVTVSVGGEIGEVGGRNSTVDELRAFMAGYLTALHGRGAAPGISKISVQTGTAHGGFVNADGSVRRDVKIDLAVLAELSAVARTGYGMAGAVQHGASTLPAEAFDAFPRSGTCEIHLATEFMNIMFDHALFPSEVKAEMYRWAGQHAAADRGPQDTDEQFIYKTRKKAIGAFKHTLWSLGEDVREAIGGALEAQFLELMRRLKVQDTAPVVAQYCSIDA